jgi:hypothetical protein
MSRDRTADAGGVPSEAGAISWMVPGFADDVVAAARDGRLWVAASAASLDHEQVWFGAVSDAGVVAAEPIALGTPCSRPAVVAMPGGALAIACTPDGRIAGAWRDERGELRRWKRATDGVPVHLALAFAGDRAWLAIELLRAAERRIVVAAVVAETGALAIERELGGGPTWCRWPALLAHGPDLVVAWCEGPARARGGVRIARMGDARAWPVTGGDPGDAPALAAMPDGRVAVAWHRGGAAEADPDRDASVVRAIDVALVALDDGATAAEAVPAGAGGAEPRGEDQGWELPAIAASADGTLWLVGRSTHGHHLAQRRSDGSWTAPVALGPSGWGGRGRRHALAVHRDAVWLARRAPDGIQIGPCPSPIAGPIEGSRPVIRPRGAAAVARDRAVLFGDLHQHTAHSDGCGAPEDLWVAARAGRGLDFAAITDHDQFCRRALGPATWQMMRHVADAFDEPGRFVAIVGYEFTGPRHPGPGHKCVYFGSRSPDRVPDRDVDALFAQLRELGGIAVPHHVGWTGGDFAHHDPAVQPVWEICSVHGCYEAAGGCAAHPPRADHVIPGQFVRDALDAGLRFGFIGSSDSHGLDWHHGIARWRNPFRSGLACLVGAEPTRDGIIAALRGRRTYATTGAMIRVHAELDGAAIGSELPAGTSGEVAVTVEGTAPIQRIAIVHRGGEHLLRGDGAHPRVTARGEVPRHDAPSYLYLRIEQADGEVAWTSPWWIG